MESIGQILKAARERRKISIEDVVAATKMSSTFVKAIEVDKFDALVAPVYARGFVKLYAQCVGLDPMPLLKQFDLSSRVVPALAPLPPKAPPRKVAVAYAEQLQPPRLQQSGSLPHPGATGKPEQEQGGSRSKTMGGVALTPAKPLRAAHAPVANRTPSWFGSLLAGRWPALPKPFGIRVQWPRFKLPGRMLPYFPLPALVWRRMFIVAGVVLLIVAASLAWEWSQRGMPSTTNACRWLSEPPAPYLTVDARPAAPGR